jgi:hypothetical protein
MDLVWRTTSWPLTASLRPTAIGGSAAGGRDCGLFLYARSDIDSESDKGALGVQGGLSGHGKRGEGVNQVSWSGFVGACVWHALQHINQYDHQAATTTTPLLEMAYTIQLALECGRC